MEKVKVTKEVAAEIEYAKEEFRAICSATQYLLNEADLTAEQTEMALKGYFGNYEVEKSPEEKIRHHYEYSKANAESTDYDVKYIPTRSSSRPRTCSTSSRPRSSTGWR